MYVNWPSLLFLSVHIKSAAIVNAILERHVIFGNVLRLAKEILGTPVIDQMRAEPLLAQVLFFPPSPLHGFTYLLLPQGRMLPHGHGSIDRRCKLLEELTALLAQWPTFRRLQFRILAS